ncbi:oligopeptide transporter subunit; membrane component of ABC superfamily [Candidatus Desulfosporosinus infrequens]|uniref:Oligopeptide transporter subunit membrane component of ABC superfamily n=1 Tax=Candidatus Desulfosporosinus infrequens TaxID=2043169 RepID=A0A2U3LY57_9FIRM|nr:oligopeptide transporter subunit; membrane component of ABC superfamily [Candidatus Desulfosporosinus infrequens]
MARYLLGRIASAIFVIWFVVTMTFFLMHSIPGGPFSTDKVLPPQIMANINERYHLKDPFLKQYIDYLKNIVQFNFGPTYRYQGRTVNDLIKEGLPKSATLGLLAAVIAVVFGTGMGVVAALRQNKAADYFVTFLATIGVSVPSFVIATLLQYYLGFKAHLFPPIGWGELKYMMMPAIALSAYPVAQITRLTRASMLDVLNQDYIRTARSKGLPGYVIVFKHAIRNALIPLLTFFGPFFAYILTGNFVVEYVFNIPGIGRSFVTSIGNRDYPVIMGTTILFATLLVTFNLLVDIAYTIVDPRIKLTGQKGV